MLLNTNKKQNNVKIKENPANKIPTFLNEKFKIKYKRPKKDIIIRIYAAGVCFDKNPKTKKIGNRNK